MANVTLTQKKNYKKRETLDKKGPLFKNNTAKNNTAKNNTAKNNTKESHFHSSIKKKIPYRTKLEKNKQIVIADSDKERELDLFCYIKCDNNSPLQVKRSRGLVFHGNDLVLKTFPYTDEYSLEDQHSMEQFIKPLFIKDNLVQCRFFRSYEGSLIRVFNFNDEWFVSTHRKLDAFKSKWSSITSFGQMFFDGVRKQMIIEEDDKRDIKEIFYSRLDKNKSYMFLVLPIEDNRVVCQVPKEGCTTVYHVGTYENFPSKVFSLDEKIPDFPKPEEYKFTDFEEFEDEIRKTNIDLYQGIIIFGPNQQLIKVLEPRYFYLFRLRGNEQSIKYRYLQIRSEGDKWKDFGKLYPNFIPDFKDYERCISQIADDIFNAYSKRYIKKENVVVPQEEFQVMRKCNQWYREDPKNNRITPIIVLEVMNYEEPTALNKMIKRLKLEQNKVKKEEPSPEDLLNSSDFPTLRASVSN
jgi:hypothetical protein